MTTLHDTLEKGKSSAFAGVIGKSGPRETQFGMAIDVADNRYRPCRWCDVIPRNPAVLERLKAGMKVCITGGEVVEDGKRPLIRGNLEIDTDKSAPASGQMRLC